MSAPVIREPDDLMKVEGDLGTAIRSNLDLLTDRELAVLHQAREILSDLAYGPPR